jgi:aldose 1-epimerase
VNRNPDQIGGAPIVTLECRTPADPPCLVSARILPGRGMMLLHLDGDLPGLGRIPLIEAPPLEDARRAFEESADFAGNASFRMGGAVLVPYANRIRGTLAPDRRTIETRVLDRAVRLPANWGGRRSDAARYAMHGLILDARADHWMVRSEGEREILEATYRADDFAGRWPAMTDLRFEYVLESRALTLAVLAINVGRERSPIGIGWHPYFRFPSGRRDQARLRVPAHRRLVVNDYDEVLPTGAIEPVDGTPYDFREPGGRALGDLYLDDCFVDLERSIDGSLACDIADPAASYHLRLVTPSRSVKAIQIYAPPSGSFVALEPQFNWADPFGSVWPPGTDTGMVILEPGESARYEVRVELVER